MEEATIKWINSTSVGVTKHFVFRNDDLLGEVLVGNPSIWIDNEAVQGATYKYEVQAATADSESTDELETVNVLHVTVRKTDSLIIHTTSKSSDWAPTLINSGEVLTWEVTGGVTIPIQTTDNPVFDLSGNTGTATITVRSTSSFAGLTSLIIDYLNVTILDVSKALDLVVLSCKGDYSLTSVNVSGLTKLESLTLRWQLLTALDISTNIALTSIWIYDNSLASLDISQNPLIALLQVHTNLLPSAQLDDIVNTLAAGSISNGALQIRDNAGLLSEDAQAGWTELDRRSWSIDSGYPIVPNIPQGINLSSL